MFICNHLNSNSRVTHMRLHVWRPNRLAALPCFSIAALLFCIISCPFPAYAVQQVTLQLHWQHQFEFAGYYAAVEQGYYEEEGLDVAIREGGPGIVPVSQMLQGRAQFCVGGAEMLLARMRDKPVVALAVIFQHSASTLLVRADSGIYTPQDLAGHVVEMGTLESDAEIFALLMNENITVDKFIHTPSSFAMDNIISRKVDALSSYISNQPYFLKKAAVPYRLLRPMWYGVDFYGDALFTTETLARTNPKLVQTFTRASLKGWTYAMSHPDDLIRTILSKYPPSLAPRTREHLWFEYQEMKKLIMPSVIEIGHMNPGRFKHMADTFAQLGLAKATNLDGFVFRPEYAASGWNSWHMQVATYGVPAGLFLILLFLAGRGRIRKERLLRRNAEQETRRMEGTLRMVLTSTQTGCWEWSVAHGTLYIDEHCAGMLELGSQSQELAPDDEIPLPENVRDIVGHIRNCLTGDADGVRFDLEFPTGHGQRRTLTVRGTIEQNDTEHTAPYLVGIMTDTTLLHNCLTELQNLTINNPASSFPSRRQFFRQSEQILRQSREQKTTACLALVEIDQLRTLHKELGYLAGEDILQQFYTVIEATLRTQDSAARIGNDEFFIMFPETTSEHARYLVESLRTNVDAAAFVANGQSQRITFSCGIACTDEMTAEDYRLRALTSLADKRLQTARDVGTDRIISG